MKKIILIRHAPTEANLTGSMVKNYDETPIIPLTKEAMDSWNRKVGNHIPYLSCKYLVSPTLRCRQTAEMLFDGHDIETCTELSEFDCSGLGDQKFWEIGKDKFEQLVPLTSADMGFRADQFITKCSWFKEDNIIAVTHGMFIRYMYHFMTGNRDISPYDVINSVGFTFSNLDALCIDMDNHSVSVHRFSKPIDHKNT